MATLRSGLFAAGMTRRGFAAGALGAGLTACGPEERARPLDAFAGYLADLSAAILADSPELASRLGFAAGADGEDYASALDDRSALALEMRRTAFLRRSAQLAAFDRARLDAEDRTTYDALAAWFEGAKAGAAFGYGRFDALGRFSPYVLDPEEAAFVAVPQLLETGGHPSGGAAALEAALARLRAFPRALRQEMERAGADAAGGVRAPDFVLARAGLRLQALLNQPLTETPFARALARAGQAAAKEDPAWRARLLAEGERLIAREVLPALAGAFEGLQRLLAQARTGAGVRELPQGEAYFAAALAAQSGLSIAPEAAGEAAAARVQELSGRLDMALRALGLTQGAPGERLAALAAEARFAWPPGPEGETAAGQALAAAATRLRAVAPRFAAGPEPAPLPAQAAPGSWIGAQYRPAQLAGDGGAALLIDGALLREAPRFALPALAAELGVPGRHLQDSRMRAADLPLARRLLPAPGFALGWAGYALGLVDDAGLFEADPHAQIGVLAAQLRGATLATLDVALHLGGRTRAEAVAAFMQTLGETPARAAAAIDRIAARPAEASAAELGRAELAQLREEARAGMGARFDTAAFHDLALAGGALPLPVLAARVRRLAGIA